MSTRELIGIVKDRGMRLTLKDGQPLLVKPKGTNEDTGKLYAVLKFHRERIIEELSREIVS